MDMKIALTNLGKYNEGELTYTWLELPFNDDELAEALEEIGIDGKEYEEYFISDYEAPFKISEYENIEALNNLAEELETIDGIEVIFDGTYDAGDVINFASELENTNIVSSAMEYVDDIVSDDMLDEIVSHTAQDGGWQRVAHLIGGINFMNDDYYLINGYGNVENLDKDHLENIVDDLLGEVLSQHI